MWLTRAISADEMRSAEMIIAAPTRLAVERSERLQALELGRRDADLQRPGLEPLRQLAEAPRHLQQRLELREAEREQLVRLEPALRLLRHHVQPSLRSISTGSSAGSSVRAMLSACESVLPTSANDVGSAIPCWRQSRCRSASASPGADPCERAPLVARQLAAQVVHEAGLVGRASSSARARGSGRRRRRRGSARSRAAAARATYACRRRAGRSARSRAARAGRPASGARSRGAGRRGRGP